MNQENKEKTEKDKKQHPKQITYFIDKEKFETTEQVLSVRFLLVEKAKEDPNSTTLALKHGNDTRKFNNLDEMIPMENGMKFIVFHNTPTTVS